MTVAAARLLVAFALCAAAAYAHLISMSTGELRLTGSRARYELRMPLYEMTHMSQPEAAIFSSIRFFSSGQQAKLLEKVCREDTGDGTLVCEGEYEFPGGVDSLTVESSLPAVTVSNHVHVLRASQGDKVDRAVLDLSFSRAELRFRPPATTEVVLRQALSGFVRPISGFLQLLFLATLVLAARGRRELLGFAIAFLAVEALVAALAVRFAWSPPPRFLEAAAALTISYLAVEILLLPAARMRWLVVALLAVFHGLHIGEYARPSDPLWAFLAGVIASEALLIAVLAFAARLPRALAGEKRVATAGAALMLVAGLAWFFLRLT